jgi:hypothetical protein
VKVLSSSSSGRVMMSNSGLSSISFWNTVRNNESRCNSASMSSLLTPVVFHVSIPLITAWFAEVLSSNCIALPSIASQNNSSLSWTNRSPLLKGFPGIFCVTWEWPSSVCCGVKFLYELALLVSWFGRSLPVMHTRIF